MKIIFKKATLFLMLTSVTGFYSRAQKMGVTDATSLVPASLLHVHLNSQNGSIFQLTNSLSGSNADHGLIFRSIDTLGVFNIRIENQENGYLAFSTAARERMRITSTGNIGIGTSDPAKTLTVIGNSFIGNEFMPVPMEYGQFVYRKKTGTVDKEIFSFLSLNDITPTANVTEKVHGSLSYSWLNSNYNYDDVAGMTAGIDHTGDGTINEITGLKAELSEQGAGTLNNAYGVVSRGGITSNGTISNYYLMFCSNPYRLGSGTFGNVTGLSIDKLDMGTNNTQILLGNSNIPSGNYGIYEATRYPSSFSGYIGLGTTDPKYRLHIVDTASPLKIEGLRFANKDTFLVISGDGVIAKRRYTESIDWKLTGNNLTGTELLGSLNSQPVNMVTNNVQRIKIASDGKIEMGMLHTPTELTVYGKALVGDSLSPFPFDMQLGIIKNKQGTVTDEPISLAALINMIPNSNVNSTVHGFASLTMLNTNYDYRDIEASYTGIHHYGGGTVNQAVCVKSDVNNAGTGHINKAYGLRSVLHIQGSGNVDEFHGIFSDGIDRSGTGIVSRLSTLTIPGSNPGINNFTGILLGSQVIPLGNFAIFDTSNYSSYFRGKIGIGTTNPVTKLDVNGDFGYRQIGLTLSSAVNDDVNVGSYSFIRVTSPGYSYSITGLANGYDGKIVTLFNVSNLDNMTIANENSGSSAVNRINTLTGSDITTTATGSVTLQYSSVDQRWIVIAVRE